MVNKCKTTMASRRLYKKGSPHEEADGEKKKREYCSNTNDHNLQTVTNIYSSYFLGLWILTCFTCVQLLYSPILTAVQFAKT